MIDIDKKEFAKIMMALAENFGDTLSVNGLELKFSALQEYSINQIKQAALIILKTRKYLKMPTVAEFIEIIEGKLEDVAHMEALKVLDAISSFGGYCSVVFDDPITQAVIKYKFGGWIRLTRNLKEKDEIWFQKDFIETYIIFAKQEIKLGGVLMGINENQTEPVFVGNTEKARQVLLMGNTNPKLSNLVNLVALGKTSQQPRPERRELWGPGEGDETNKNNSTNKTNRTKKAKIYQDRQVSQSI